MRRKKKIGLDSNTRNIKYRRSLRCERLEERVNPVTFANAVSYSTDANPDHLNTADFNGDGKLDVVFTSPSGLNVMLNDGKGTLLSPSIMGVGGTFATQVAIGDLNADGKIDLVVGTSFAQRVAIFRGNGNGTFQAPILKDITLPVENLALGDFNGDSKTDIAIVSAGSGMGVLFNDGTPNLVDNPVYFSTDAQSSNARGIATSDFNGDGQTDVAYIDYNFSNQERLTVFLGQKNNTFQTTGPSLTGSPLSFYHTDVIANTIDHTPLDLNADGFVDLAIGYGGNGFIGVYMGHGDGTFSQPSTFSTAHPAAGSLAAADFDQDGKLDLACSVFNSGGNATNGIPILLGDGKGNFGAPYLVSTFFDQNSVTAADINADGFPDLITTVPQSPGTVSVFKNTSAVIPVIKTFDVVPTFSIITAGSTTVTITARDQTGAVFTGYTGTVHFTSSDPNAVLPGDYTFLPQDKGQHVFTPVVLKTAGVQNVSVSDSAILTASGSSSITVLAGAPAFLSAISGDGQSSIVNQAFANPLAIKITDVFGNALSNVTVLIFTPSNGASAVFNPSSTLTTDANGIATTTPTANTIAGQYSVTLTAVGVAKPAVFSLTNLPGSIAFIGTVSGGNQITIVNTAFGSALATIVTDAFNNPIPGVSVTFAAPANAASATFSSGNVVFTNSVGQASIIPSANTKAGTYAVSASVVGFAAQASFGLTNAPGSANSILATAGSGQSAIVATAYASQLVATVTDAFGNPVPGVSVTFVAPSIGGSVTFTNNNPVVTDNQGTAKVSPVANNKSAINFSVTASSAGIGAVATWNLSNIPGVALNIIPINGMGQSVLLGQSFPTPLETMVTDQFGNPVSGANITFSVPINGASSTLTGSNPTLTNANGIAQILAQANGFAGKYQIQAKSTGLASPAVFSMENIGPRPTLIGYQHFAVGSDRNLTNYTVDGTANFTIYPFPNFTGGIRTASADFNGDGIADFVVGTGPGSATHVKVFDGVSQAELFSIDPFEASFTGGVFVAAGDINGDGKAELAISPDEGGGPRVRVFNGNGFTQIADFFGIDDPNFRGGARSAIGDMNGDGKGDLIVAAGFGGGPRVAAFDGSQLTGNGGPKLFGDFFAFETGLRNGIFVAAGDVNGDGFADLVAGGGPGGGPRVYILDGKSLVHTGSNTLVPDGNFFAGDVNNRGGVRVAVKNLDNDSKADVLTGSGTGAGSRVTAYLGTNISAAGGTPPTALDFDAFAGFSGGVFVG